MHVQRGYRSCHFSKEGTDMDIHRDLDFVDFTFSYKSIVINSLVCPHTLQGKKRADFSFETSLQVSLFFTEINLFCCNTKREYVRIR